MKKQDNNLMGFKNKDFLDSKYFYSPYVPIHITPSVINMRSLKIDFDSTEFEFIDGIETICRVLIRGVYAYEINDDCLTTVGDVRDANAANVGFIISITQTLQDGSHISKFVFTDTNKYWLQSDVSDKGDPFLTTGDLEMIGKAIANIDKYGIGQYKDYISITKYNL